MLLGSRLEIFDLAVVIESLTDTDISTKKKVLLEKNKHRFINNHDEETLRKGFEFLDKNGYN